jgi:hypothetical protein
MLPTLLSILILTLSIAGCATPDLGSAKRVGPGDIITDSGVFLTEGQAKKMAQIVKERDALRKEYSDYPDRWSRFWTSAFIFTVGAGVGTLLP